MGHPSGKSCLVKKDFALDRVHCLVVRIDDISRERVLEKEQKYDIFF